MSGLLNTLVVHPDFRRRGIATALVTWCVQAARERFGDEGVVWALIQRGNVGSVTPFETPFRRYLVLTDGAGEILAGAAVEEGYRLGTLHVKDMSPSLRVLNGLLHLVPADGVSKGLTISKAWCAFGRVQAARHLVENIRWRWRDRATTTMAQVDRESPLVRAFPLRPWTPAPRLSVVATGPVVLSPERYIAY